MSAYVITHAAIVNPDNATTVPDASVYVEGERIREVTTGTVKTSMPTVSARGLAMVPGLIDLHTHVTAATTDLAALARMSPTLVVSRATAVLAGMLQRGFTSVRDAGGADWGLAEAIRRGYIVGPRLFPSGLALAQTGGQGDFRAPHEETLGCPHCHTVRSISRVADGVDEITKAARDELRKGASQLKVMASGGLAGPRSPGTSHFTVEEIAAVVREATAAGTYVMAHAYGPTSISRALEAGVGTIEHGNLIDAPTAQAMAGRAVMVPTLAVYRANVALGPKIGLQDNAIGKFEEMLVLGTEALETCADAGVEIGFGTDLEGDLQVFQGEEFRLRRAVLTSPAILRSATTVGAAVLGMTGQLGVIADGAYADFLLVDGDPLQDVTVLGRLGPGGLRMIVKGGVVHRSDMA